MTVQPQTLRATGVFGVLAIVSYLTAIFVPMSWSGSFAVGMAFPLCGIIYVYGLFAFIGTENDGLANRAGLIFSIGGFVLLAAMMAVQLAVRAGFEEYQGMLGGIPEDMWPSLRRILRLVDWGLDVAWDFFIGSGLIASGLAMTGHSRFRWVWGGPMMAFGAALMILNAWTFPWPPDSRDLFDVGPAIGLFMLALSVRMIVESRRSVS